MRGRKPKPSMLHELHGRPRDRPPPPHEPKPVGDLTEPPEWMTPEQQDGWRYAIAHSPPGLLKHIDRGALVVWVSSESLHRAALMQQAQHGLVIKAPITGTPIQSPYLAIINRQALIMLKAASELGFSPVARPRVGVMPSIAAPLKLAGGSSAVKSTPRRSLDEFLDNAPSRSVN